MHITNLSEIIRRITQEYLLERPHTRHGLSTHGSCAAKQALNKLNPKPFTAHGKTAPGTGYHEFIQEKVMPSGTIIENEAGEEEWEIVGHEQYVFYHDGRVLRKSPIDTLVYNLLTKELEVWDWKSTRTDKKYLYKKPLVYKAQVNFYAYLLKLAWNLEYDPICRIIYGEKIDWLSVKDLDPFRMDEKLGKWSFKNIALAYDIAEHLDDYIDKWDEVVKVALGDWTKTRKPYRYECKYCDHRMECLSYLGYDYTKENEERLIYDRDFPERM